MKARTEQTGGQQQLPAAADSAQPHQCISFWAWVLFWTVSPFTTSRFVLVRIPPKSYGPEEKLTVTVTVTCSTCSGAAGAAGGAGALVLTCFSWMCQEY